MKTRQRENSLKSTLRQIFRGRVRKHDPLLVLNMATFNFTGGWSRTFSNHHYARSYA